MRLLTRRFVAQVALRYFRSRRRSGAASTALSILGVTVGVMTLTAVLGVMNGFQLGFIESILEVSSYHIQVEGPAASTGNAPAGNAGASTGAEMEALLRELRGVRGVVAAVPFREEQIIVEGVYDEQRGCLLRRVPETVEALDPGFRQRLEIVEGRFDLAQRRGMVIGAELARHLGVGPGDTVSVVALGGSSFDALEPERRTYLVTGLFRSGYYDFDLGWAFASLEDAQLDAAAAAVPADGAAGGEGEAEIRVGVKIRNRFRDQEALLRIRSLVAGRGYTAASWREFNRAFFGALRTEKIMMMVLVGLIFVVVGFNIYHGLRRAIRERYEDIGVLKALGASDAAVQYVFVLEGLLIGLVGGGLGLLLGLLIAGNINWVFRAAEQIINLLVSLFFRLTAPLAGGEPFSLFSPAYFYISEIPSRVLFHETLLIVLFAVVSCTLAAMFASSRVRAVRPAEVLRYE